MIKKILAGAAILSLCSLASAANLVGNGSFETGDFTDWSLTGNTGYTGVANTPGLSVTGASAGNDYAFFGAVGSSGYLTQTLATAAGQTYTLTFDLADDQNSSGQSFGVSYNGVSLMTLSGANPATPGYDHYSFTFAGVDNGALQFALRNDPAYYALDNISVSTSAVPEAASGTLMLAALAAMGLTVLRRRTAR